jgi:hypothetical protein
MAALFEVKCPCCESTLQIDPETKAVIQHHEPVKKPLIEDLSAAVQQLKADAEKRSDIFAKSFDEHLNSSKVREKKFDELLKQAKEDTSAPPKRAFDFD